MGLRQPDPVALLAAGEGGSLVEGGVEGASPAWPASSADYLDEGPVKVEDVFVDLYREQFASLVRLARLLAHFQDAEDTVQAAFVALYRRGALADPATAVGYLRRTVLNLTRSRWRHLQTAARHGWLFEREGERAQPDLAVGLTVRRALMELPRRQREAVVLRYFVALTE